MNRNDMESRHFRALKIKQNWDWINARKDMTYTIWIGAKNINLDSSHSQEYFQDPWVK